MTATLQCVNSLAYASQPCPLEICRNYVLQRKLSEVAGTIEEIQHQLDYIISVVAFTKLSKLTTDNGIPRDRLKEKKSIALGPETNIGGPELWVGTHQRVNPG